MTRAKHQDYPLAECAAAARAIVKEHPTAKVFQKFTCAGCGTRQTMEKPNVFHKTGKCEVCGHVTDIAKRGCNYMIHYLTTGADAVDILQSMMWKDKR